MLLTLFFQVNSALCDDNGHVAVDVALAMLVEQRDGDVGIGYALDEWHAKDAGERSFCVEQYMSVNAHE